MNFLDLIKEGRVDDFKSKYGSKFSAQQIKRITDSIPPKFLMWVGKTFDPMNFDQNFPQLYSSISKFENIGSNLPQTDINQYGSVNDLIQAISTYENRSRRDFKKIQGANLIYDDGKLFVVNPLDYDSSCYYGKVTKWCTASSNPASFRNYNSEGKLFYIIDRTKKTDDPFYKVALLRKFNGDNIFYDAQDNIIRDGDGWILDSPQLNPLTNAIEDYLKKEFPEQLEIFKNEMLAKQERERLRRLEIQRELNIKRNAAQERRLDGDWNLSNPNIREIGLKANALLEYLVLNGDVQTEDSDGENYVDVYNIVPNGEFYRTSEFEVIDSPVDGQRFAVGDDYDMEQSCVEYLEEVIYQEGIGSFRGNFVKDYIDKDKVVEWAQEFFDYDIRENGEDYGLDESSRMLSSEQEQKISLLRSRIQKNYNLIRTFQEQGQTEWFTKKISELGELNEEYQQTIDDIESEPEGDFPQELLDDEVERLVNNAKNNISSFMEDYGLNYEDYVDTDELIKGIIETDGYGQILNHYDGGAEEIYVKDSLFYVMRID